MRFGHAAGCVEQELDVGELPLHFGRLEFHRLRQEKDRDGKQGGRQTVRDENKNAEEPAAPLFSVIEWHHDRMPAPDKFPEHEDYRHRQEGEKLGVLECHGVPSSRGLVSAANGAISAAISSRATGDAG